MVNSRLCCDGTQLIACYLAELLYRLGLRRYPPLETIVTLSSDAPDTTVRETAFKYLCDNLGPKYSDYNPDNFQDIAFIPAENNDGTCLEKLGNVRCPIPRCSSRQHTVPGVYGSSVESAWLFRYT